jgi:hypothetical protein
MTNPLISDPGQNAVTSEPCRTHPWHDAARAQSKVVIYKKDVDIEEKKGRWPGT